MKFWLKFCKKLIIGIFISYPIFLVAAPSIEGLQIYQKNVHLSFEHKQKIAADLYRYQTADNIWEVLRHEFILPHYESHPRVIEQISWFLNHPDFLYTTMTRASPYLYFILQQVHIRHLPVELVLLPMIESGYNPFAYSTTGAAGLWQIMPNTASGFGIKQDWWYDGRRDVVASTRAALDYLSYLGGFFEGNWQLAIAAYDTGEGNVLSAIKRNIREGKNTDFWSLPLALETRIYVPRLLALAAIISHPERYPIMFPQVQNAPYLAQIDIGGQIDLTHAAELAGLSLKKLKQLNPGYNRSATDPHGPFKLVLPIEHVEQFSENLSRSTLYQRINWKHYQTKPGDTVKLIARKFNTTPSSLHSANPTLLASKIKPGTHLVIPQSSTSIGKNLHDADEFIESENKEQSLAPAPVVKERNPLKIIANALQNFQQKYTLQPGDTLYMVRNNDDLDKIANRFHIQRETLISINQLKNAAVLPGEKLIIPTHLTNRVQKYELTPGDTIYVVRTGDDIHTIAKKFHTSIAAIRLANLLMDDNVHEGDRLVIPTVT